MNFQTEKVGDIFTQTPIGYDFTLTVNSTDVTLRIIIVEFQNIDFVTR